MGVVQMMSGCCNTLWRRKRSSLKNVALLFSFFLINGLSLFGIASATEFYEVTGKEIKMVNSDVTRSCTLDAKPIYAVASYDRSAVIVSERGYVKKADLDNCRSEIPVRVHLIPDRVGFLSDINLRKKIYVALEFVNIQPFLYLATVAHIGSSKNVVMLNGAYISGKYLSQIRMHAFNASGEAGASLISPDGRYVAPNGVVSCAYDAFPGVWDIANNKKVVLNENSCSSLFDLENR
ncbi:hypothetical protein U0E10_22025 [Burkholderia ubonensis]|uniref:hypothetical protein n=1 Tax=Burkholderia ubonensis TaxID=101571 RepID=UPI002AB4942E|nr:hypothetical protein [Burkholderia ubonensis]MDY7790575.1 hypothetical protein [Burkholderia ubonensis]